uniref:Uncharacterized protein n=1 Tax=Rhizophora mucronata TaxID=61149 RepID=A0A2P2PGJ1_RHIMU
MMFFLCLYNIYSAPVYKLVLLIII